MFKLAAQPAYYTPVLVDIPLGGGRFESRRFDAQFKRMSQAELDEIRDGIADGSIRDRELINRVMIGWRGVGDENGQELEFNEENLTALLNLHPTQESIARAFFESLRKGPSAKN